jgi:electron transport complex protein RnfB
MVQERGQGPGVEQKCGCGGGRVRGGRGPQGTCVCATCGHQVPHAPGVPCREVKCPQCNGAMTRRD